MAYVLGIIKDAAVVYCERQLERIGVGTGNLREVAKKVTLVVKLYTARIVKVHPGNPVRSHDV